MFKVQQRVNRDEYHQHCVKSVQIRIFFFSTFSRILTEYGDLLRKSLYWVRLRENTDQKKLCIWTLFTQCKLVSLFWHQQTHTLFSILLILILLIHIPCIVLFTVYFRTVISMFRFFCYWSHSNANAVNQMIQLCFY